MKFAKKFFYFRDEIFEFEH